MVVVKRVAWSLAACLFFVTTEATLFLTLDALALVPLPVEIKETRAPYDMYIENRPVELLILVTNNSPNDYNGTLNARLDTFPAQPDRYINNTFFFPLKAHSTEPLTFTTQFPLEAGPWNMRAFAHSVELGDEPSSERNGIPQYYYAATGLKDVSFYVFTQQDFDNRVMSYGTLAAAIGTISAVSIQVWSNRMNSKQLKQEIENERQAKWIEAYREHSKLIGPIIFDGWNKSRILATCQYENGILKYERPRERTIDELSFVQNAKIHFERGYPDVWELVKKAQAESVKVCDEIQAIILRFEDSVLNELSVGGIDLPRLDAWNNDMERFYSKNLLCDGIFKEAEYRSKNIAKNEVHVYANNRPIPDGRGLRRDIQVYELTCAEITMARSLNEPEVKKLQSIVDRLMSDSAIQCLVAEYRVKKFELQNSAIAEEMHQAVRAISLNTGSGGALLEAPRACYLCDNQAKIILKE
jgi:hypothetical protein